MTLLEPTFPPLLCGHKLLAGEDPLQRACAGVAAGDFGAGDILWSEETNHLRFALVLEPEVSRERCGEMVYAAMVAFGDAAGALIPPEIAVTYQWPGTIQMNDGQIGFVDLVVSDAASDGVPIWMVLSLDIQMMPGIAETNPGEHYHVTTLWDEGCGEITLTELLESTSRHLVNAIHNWSEDGFKPVHEQWIGRLNKDMKLGLDYQADDQVFVGLDEVGSGLLRVAGDMRSVPIIDALAASRNHRLNLS